jgi:hypothetical protein
MCWQGWQRKKAEQHTPRSDGEREREGAKKGRSEGRKRDGQKECSKEEVDEAETQVFSLMRNS